MNKYLREPSEVIDLHGLTTAEARVILGDLLSSSEGTHLRLIVGKGNHSERGPVLRSFVKSFLTARGIKHEQSKIRDGGEGALEVYF